MLIIAINNKIISTTKSEKNDQLYRKMLIKQGCGGIKDDTTKYEKCMWAVVWDLKKGFFQFVNRKMSVFLKKISRDKTSLSSQISINCTNFLKTSLKPQIRSV